MHTGWLAQMACLICSMQVNVRPKIVSGPRNITAPVGQKLLELECGIQAASFDVPEVFWRKDGAELEEFGLQHNLKKMRLAKNNNSLLIFNVSSADQGELSAGFYYVLFCKRAVLNCSVLTN